MKKMLLIAAALVVMPSAASAEIGSIIHVTKVAANNGATSLSDHTMLQIEATPQTPVIDDRKLHPDCPNCCDSKLPDRFHQAKPQKQTS